MTGDESTATPGQSSSSSKQLLSRDGATDGSEVGGERDITSTSPLDRDTDQEAQSTAQLGGQGVEQRQDAVIGEDSPLQVATKEIEPADLLFEDWRRNCRLDPEFGRSPHGGRPLTYAIWRAATSDDADTLTRLEAAAAEALATHPHAGNLSIVLREMVHLVEACAGQEAWSTVGYRDGRLRKILGLLGIGAADNSPNWKELAERDELTGLRNRRGFDLDFELALTLARETETPLSVVVADLDGLKKVNDERGHEAGDALLRNAAGALGAATSLTVTAYRWGGDEYALLVRDAVARDATTIMSRIVERAETPPMSFGVSSYPNDAELPGELLDAADRAMYSMKSARATQLPAMDVQDASPET